VTDVLGWRKVFGVIGPSTNTVVQPDMEAMRPAGVTNQYRDIYVENPSALSDSDFVAGTDRIGAGVLDALRTAVTCAPDYLVLGMSAITFMGGRAGCDAFMRQVEDATGLRASAGSRSVVAALQAFGNVRRVAFLSPYYPSANAQVRGYLEEHDFEVVRDIPAMHQLARYRAAARGAARADAARARWRRRRRDRPGRHQPVDGAAGRLGRGVAGQAGDRDQHGDLLARAARQRHP